MPMVWRVLWVVNEFFTVFLYQTALLLIVNPIDMKVVGRRHPVCGTSSPQDTRLPLGP